MLGVLVEVPDWAVVTQWIFTAALVFHIRLGIELYQIGKGVAFLKLGNGKWNWLAILLQLHLACTVTEASLMTIMLGGCVREEYCQTFIHGVYSVYVLDTICVSYVLYSRAAKINTKLRHIVIPCGLIFPGLEIAARITEAGYIDPSIPGNYLPPGILSTVYGYCGAVFGWPTSFISITSIANDCVQMAFFALPIYDAVRQAKGMANTGTYNRILLNCASYLTVAAIFYLTSIPYGQQGNTWASVTFREIAQLAHTLGACEVQFNSHRKTSSDADSQGESSNNGAKARNMPLAKSQASAATAGRVAVRTAGTGIDDTDIPA
ncbi:hypothetical protein HDU87_003052 [Geranomyces variabilis]|uniref:Uncharacterized protein n=1 Tax=Geranomyces variabilis TaxID=109894 RepID=A0AAD5TL95_9FUNG|nr:hypothetical protein HDU87_003052 [Geranomyces variabilis]